MVGTLQKIHSADDAAQKTYLAELAAGPGPMQVAAQKQLGASGVFYEDTALKALKQPATEDGAPTPQEVLRFNLVHGDNFQKELAANALGRHGTDADIHALSKLAVSGDQFQAQEALNSMVQLHSSDIGEQLNYLSSLASPRSPFSEVALNSLRNVDSGTWKHSDLTVHLRTVAQQMSVHRNPDSSDAMNKEATGALASALDRIPNQEMQRTWFGYAMESLGKSEHPERYQLALKDQLAREVKVKVSGLQQEALAAIRANETAAHELNGRELSNASARPDAVGVNIVQSPWGAGGT
jgi:hypothetical protein